MVSSFPSPVAQLPLLVRVRRERSFVQGSNVLAPSEAVNQVAHSLPKPLKRPHEGKRGSGRAVLDLQEERPLRTTPPPFAARPLGQSGGLKVPSSNLGARPLKSPLVQGFSFECVNRGRAALPDSCLNGGGPLIEATRIPRCLPPKPVEVARD